MKSTVTDSDIIKMFQNYISTEDSSEIDKLDVEKLKAAEARMRLRQMNPQFCDVIKTKIKDLELRDAKIRESNVKEIELKEARKHESKVRAWNLVTGLILGLVIAGVSALLFNI